jgi:hypothetical protein
MMKLEANIEAVILWQSAQLQTKEPTRPGPWVGWEGGLEWLCRGEGWTYE